MIGCCHHISLGTVYGSPLDKITMAHVPMVIITPPDEIKSPIRRHPGRTRQFVKCIKYIGIIRTVNDIIGYLCLIEIRAGLAAYRHGVQTNSDAVPF